MLSIIPRGTVQLCRRAHKFHSLSSPIALCGRSSSISFRYVTTDQQASSSDRNVQMDNEENSRLHQQANEFQSIAKYKLTDINEFRRPLPPVAKKLFMGEIVSQIFTYPDILPNDRYFALEQRSKKLYQIMSEKRNILLETICNEGKIPKDVLLALRSQGFYGLDATTEEGGEGLSVTETTRMFEELASINLSLSETLASAATMGYKAIQFFGSDEQKAKYLPKLISGQWIGALCCADENSGCDLFSTTTKGRYASEESCYYISGKKTMVTNGPSADVFTVLTNIETKGEEGYMTKKLTALIVDRNSHGVTVHSNTRDQKKGLRGLETCDVTFNKTPVPECNVISSVGSGAEVISAVFEQQRLYTAARMCAGLRNILDTTVNHILSRKVHGNPLATYDQVRFKISRCATHLFALESAIYMAAGLADYQSEPDVSLEFAISKYFAMKVSKLISGHCSELLGSRTYLSHHPVQEIIDDLHSFTWWEGTEEILGMYIAISGLSYAGKEVAEEVYHARNPLQFPIQVYKHSKRLSNGSKKNPKLNLGIGDHLHPTLSAQADKIEGYLIRFGFAVTQVMVNEGYNAIMKEIDLIRLADLSSQLFVCCSVLARASRSYCGGHEHANHEVQIALAYINDVGPSIESNLEAVILQFHEKNDQNMETVVEYMIEKGRYATVHPMTKNFF